MVAFKLLRPGSSLSRHPRFGGNSKHWEEVGSLGAVPPAGSRGIVRGSEVKFWSLGEVSPKGGWIKPSASLVKKITSEMATKSSMIQKLRSSQTVGGSIPEKLSAERHAHGVNRTVLRDCLKVGCLLRRRPWYELRQRRHVDIFTITDRYTC